MSEQSKSPEFRSRPDYDELVEKLEALLEKSEPSIYLNPVELPFGLKYPPRTANSYRTAEISHDSWYTRLQVAESSTYAAMQPGVQSRLNLLGYYVTDQGSFLIGKALWRTDVSPDLLDPEDVQNIIGCIDGKIPVRSDVFNKFKTPTDAM